MTEPTSPAEREPMSSERLAVIRAEVTRPSKYALEHDAKDIACELLAEVDRLAARVAELEAAHARCPDYYLGGPGPRVIEVSAFWCECGCQPDEPCTCTPDDCDCGHWQTAEAGCQVCD